MELDGVPVTTEQLATLAFLNYGHFTTMRVERDGVRGLSLHLRRLVDDGRTLFDTELDPDRVRHLVRLALRDTAAPVTVRVTVFDPALSRARPAAAAQPRILVTRRAVADPMLSLRVRSTVYCRDMPEVKHVGLFGALQRRRAAQREGFDDVLFVDTGSRVCEGATWNVGFVDGERVLWPEAEYLPGVTMRLLRGIHEPTGTTPIGLGDLSGMEAAFATNANIGVHPVSAIDSVHWDGEHPVVRQLREKYADIAPDPL